MSRWVTHPYLCPPTCPACRDDDARAVAAEEGKEPKRPYTPPVDTGWGLPEPGMEPDRAEERIERDRERWAS